MATTIARLEAVLGADTGQFDRALNQSEGRMKSMGKAAALGGLAIAGGLAVGLKKSVDAALESEKAQARLSQAMASAGIDADKFGAQIEKSIQSTSKLAALDDEDLSDSFAKLARTTGDVQKATEGMGLAADIARARNISLEAATKMVERAMTGNEAAFSRIGIKLKETATAQDVLAAAQAKFGGAAEEYGKTAAGAQERFGVAVENLQEKIGSKLLPVLAKLMEVALAVISSIETNWPKIAAVIGPIMDKIRAKIEQVIADIQAIWEKHGETIMQVVTTAFNVIRTVVENAMKVIQGVVNVMMGVLTGDWARAWDGVKGIVSGTFEAVRTILVNVLPLLAAAAKAIGAGILGAITGALSGIAGKVWELITGIGGKIGEGDAAIKGWGASVGSKVKQAAVDALVGIGSAAWGIVNNIGGVISEAADTIRGWGSSVGGWIKSAVVDALIGIGAGAWGIINNIWEFVSERAGAVKSWGSSIGGWIKDAILGGITGIGQGIWEKIKGAVDWVRDKMPSLPKIDLNPFGDPADPNFDPFIGAAGAAVGASGGINLMGANPEMMPFAVAAQGLGLRVTSGLRPGTITANGTLSDHARGKALDVAGSAFSMGAFFDSLVGNRSVKQAFYDPKGSIFGGLWNSYREGGHSGHVHVATYDKGGWLQPGLTLAYNGTGAPERVGGRAGDVHLHFHGDMYGQPPRQFFKQIRDGLRDLDLIQTGGRVLNATPTLS